MRGDVLRHCPHAVPEDLAAQHAHVRVVLGHLQQVLARAEADFAPHFPARLFYTSAKLVKLNGT